MNDVIATHDLRKVYRTRRGSRTAVDGLDLRVPQGGVHGFLGPNGSGKTTTIRMLLGLARPTSGEISLFGRPVPRALPEVIGRIGAVVESPKFSPNLTGRDNLLLLARTIGQRGPRVADAVETVGLTGREHERYRSYSLGMRQRLAIAATLLKDPELLILDEPTNGLDPAGIAEVRETIRRLSGEGVTVLLSSHLLAEVQQVCTSATILAQGRLLASGPVSELLATETTHRVRIAASAMVSAHQALVAAGLRPLPVPGVRGLLEVSCDDPALITRTLAEAGVYLSELTPAQPDLESVFLRLTEGCGPGAKEA